jgi:hypothetical protein
VKSGKQGTNLGNNAAIIGEYGNLSGSILNLAIFMKSQLSSGIQGVEFLTFADGSGGFYTTTRIGLVLSSLCYVVKYNGRGTSVDPFGLPVSRLAYTTSVIVGAFRLTPHRPFCRSAKIRLFSTRTIHSPPHPMEAREWATSQLSCSWSASWPTSSRQRQGTAPVNTRC